MGEDHSMSASHNSSLLFSPFRNGVAAFIAQGISLREKCRNIFFVFLSLVPLRFLKRSGW
jgi:hypothetical protein